MFSQQNISSQPQRKLLRLQITSWKQLQNGLFDYRTDKYQQKFLFFGSKYKLPPPTSKGTYYIIHQPSSNDMKSVHKQFRLEKRRHLETNWDGMCKMENYKIMGAFKITKKRNDQVSIQIFAAEKILNKNNQEKITKILPFWVIRTFPKWELKDGQIIKFGRLQLLVSKVGIGPDKDVDNNNEDSILDIQQKLQASALQSKNGQQKRCKMCYTTQAEDPQRKLITPCNCKGSIKYVHVDCLKEWLMNKMTKISLQNGELKVNDKECCQVCKAKYPVKIKKDGRTIPIMNYISQYDYIKFQLTNNQGLLSNQRQIYLSFEDEKSVKIGRLQESNGLLLGDQTVSRHHSILQIQDDKCFIKDLQSKYGTLVYDQGLVQRIGRSLVAFQIQNSVFCFQYY